MTPPYPQRYVELGRADRPPKADLGQEMVVRPVQGPALFVIVTSQDERGDLHAVGGGKRLVAIWSRVLDNQVGIVTRCWRWRITGPSE